MKTNMNMKMKMKIIIKKKNNPQHCSITKEDTINRFFIIPGSSSRSEYIATKYLSNLKIKKHPRGHHFIFRKYKRHTL